MTEREELEAKVMEGAQKAVEEYGETFRILKEELIKQQTTC